MNLPSLILKQTRRAAGLLLPLASLFGIVAVLYDFGFELNEQTAQWLEQFYQIFLHVIGVLLLMRIDYVGLWKKNRSYTRTEWLLLGIFLGFWFVRILLNSVLSSWQEVAAVFNHQMVHVSLIFLLFFAELSLGSLNRVISGINPAVVFLVSFLLIIFIGTILLMLPNSTYTGIAFTDALFTSTSAVCVTGLIVVDTATYFTPMGQNIILFLFQLGGLGILTFTSFFGIYLRTSSSFQSQLMIGDMMNEDRLGDVFKTIVRVVVFTLLFEGMMAVGIFFTLEPRNFADTGDMWYFAVFHAVSAFCNAGFSTLSAGLYDVHYRYNFFFLTLIAVLIVTGGLGFQIIFNLFKYAKLKLLQVVKRLFTRETVKYRARLVNVQTKIVFITTAGLLLFGTMMNLFLEYNNTLAEFSLTGKLVHAFFASVTPRTAGFNAIDMSALLPATILIYFLLMLIGGSPGSTAGGIKTTTFAIAVMNVISLARGKNRVEVFRREISVGSLRRALGVISLSLLFIGLSVFLIHIVQPGLETTEVIFECISAFCTVGLSLGITPELNTASKYILVTTMFIGRIGTLTLFVAFFRKVSSLNYRYPTESILIS